MFLVAPIFDDNLNFIFCSITIGAALFALLGIWRPHSVSGGFLAIAPGLLTGIGVLGTFVGILRGLVDFDVQNISASVPILLDGMKTAFVTSVVGMGSGLLVKCAGEIFRPRDDFGPEDATAGDIVNAIHAMRDAISRDIDRLRTAISGGGDDTLITQIQKLRIDMQDNLQENRKQAGELGASMLSEIRAISTRLAEDNAKAFIEALETAIKDFNSKLTEQFGENFKQLNLAVGRLLEWQEQYRQQMADMAERLNQATASTERSASAMAHIAASSDSVVEAARRLEELLNAYALAQADLQARLKAFANMAEQASTALPKIEEKVAQLTEGFGDAVMTATTSVRALVDEQLSSLISLNDGIKQMRTSVEESTRTVAKQATEVLQASEQAVRRSVDTSMSQIETAIRETNDRVARRLEEHSNALSERLGRQVLELDGQLQDELTRAIEMLGSKLAAVSGHLADDYGRLAARLTAIARAAQYASETER